MATDPMNNSVLLFQGGGTTAKTWDWTGLNWTLESPPVSPDACGGLAWDASSSQMLLEDGSQTWQWDGSYWLQLNPQTTAAGDITSGPEGDGVLAYNVTGAGEDITTQIWQWSGTNWAAYLGSPLPPASLDVQLSDGPTGIVLFGGILGTSQESNQTWIFSALGSSPPANTPEAPFAVALPLVAFGLIGGIVWFRRRRSVPRSVG
jgi:hypothetical protein